MIITGTYPSLRLRRSRKYDWSRRLVQEHNLSFNDLVLPIFLTDGNNKKIPIESMPGVFRYSINNLGIIVDKAIAKGIPMIALFPHTNPKLKNTTGKEYFLDTNEIALIIDIKLLFKSRFSSL